MKRLYLLLLIVSTTTSIASEEEGTCQRCQRVREYNKAHPENNFYWYDDYLEKQKAQKDPKEENTVSEKASD